MSQGLSEASKAALERGIEDAKAGRVVTRDESFSQYAEDDEEPDTEAPEQTIAALLHEKARWMAVTGCATPEEYETKQTEAAQEAEDEARGVIMDRLHGKP